MPATRCSATPDVVSARSGCSCWSTRSASPALALLSAWLLARVNPGRPWDAALFALSPALALTALINWDLLAVVLVAGALGRGRGTGRC